jgi:hypothetical protein
VHRPGSRLLQRGLGSGEGGDIVGYAEVAKDVRDSVGYSDLRFSEFFYSLGVRSNARMNSNFKFLKSFTLGCQHIKQGFQRYFC